jgi:hypothetical protein
MAYSKKPRVLAVKYVPTEWPAARWDPHTGEERVFNSPAEVPCGWLDYKSANKKPPVGVVLDRDELVAKLTEMGIEINPLWGNAHMKRIIDGDVSPAG